MSVTTRVTDDDVGLGNGQKVLLPLGLSPDDVHCPICVETITDPFVTSCGHTFCYQCISMHLKHKNSCPSCGDYLTPDNIYPNFLLNKILRKAATAPPAGPTSLVDQVQRLIADNMALDRGQGNHHRGAFPHLGPDLPLRPTLDVTPALVGDARRSGKYAGSGCGWGSGTAGINDCSLAGNIGGRLRLQLRDIDAVLEALYEAREELERRESSDVLHLLLCFLHHAREQKARQMSELRQQLACLEHDILSVQSSSSSSAVVGAAAGLRLPITADFVNSFAVDATAAAAPVSPPAQRPLVRGGILASATAAAGARPTVATQLPAPSSGTHRGIPQSASQPTPPQQSPENAACHVRDAMAGVAAGSGGWLRRAHPHLNPHVESTTAGGLNGDEDNPAAAAAVHTERDLAGSESDDSQWGQQLSGVSGHGMTHQGPPRRASWFLHTFTSAGGISSVTVDTSSLTEPGQQAEVFSAAVQHAIAAARAASGSVSAASGGSGDGAGSGRAARRVRDRDGEGAHAGQEGLSGDAARLLPADDATNAGTAAEGAALRSRIHPHHPPVAPARRDGGSVVPGAYGSEAAGTSVGGMEAARAGDYLSSTGTAPGVAGRPVAEVQRMFPWCGSADNFQLLLTRCAVPRQDQPTLQGDRSRHQHDHQHLGGLTHPPVTSEDVADDSVGTGTVAGGRDGGGGGCGDDNSALSGGACSGGAPTAAQPYPPPAVHRHEAVFQALDQQPQDQQRHQNNQHHVHAEHIHAQQGQLQMQQGLAAHGPQAPPLSRLAEAMPPQLRLGADPAAGSMAAAAPTSAEQRPALGPSPEHGLSRSPVAGTTGVQPQPHGTAVGAREPPDSVARGNGRPCGVSPSRKSKGVEKEKTPDDDEDDEDEMDVRERRRGRARCNGLNPNSSSRPVAAASAHTLRPQGSWLLATGSDPARARDVQASAEAEDLGAVQAAKRQRMLSQFDALEQCYLQMRAARPSMSGNSVGPLQELPPAPCLNRTCSAPADLPLRPGVPLPGPRIPGSGAAGITWGPEPLQELQQQQDPAPPSTLGDSRGTAAAAARNAGSGFVAAPAELTAECTVARPARQELPCSPDGVHCEAHSNGSGVANLDLSSFGAVLAAATQYSRLEVLAEIPPYGSASGSGSGSSGLQILSSIEFDLTGNLFATAGVVPRILIYEYQTLLASQQAPRPVTELTTRSKLSCLSYSPAMRQHLLAADYQGGVALWDTESGMQVQDYEAHERRVWGVDFCPARPDCFASGSDDGMVKIWSARQASNCMSLELRGNVCSVEFHPSDPNLLAVGSALHCGVVYDMRRPSAPLHTLLGHRKAVSYVRWLVDRPMELVTASTDSTLKLWSMGSAQSLLPAVQTHPLHVAGAVNSSPAAAPGRLCGAELVRTFSGHVNERNFVGLCTGTGDMIACGSESNEVVVYHRSFPQPALRFGLTGRMQEASQRGGLLPPGAATLPSQRFATNTPHSAGHWQQQQQHAAGGSAAGTATANTGPGSRAPNATHHFVTALQWRQNSPHLLAANSAGYVWLLGLKL